MEKLVPVLPAHLLKAKWLLKCIPRRLIDVVDVSLLMVMASGCYQKAPGKMVSRIDSLYDLHRPILVPAIGPTWSEEVWPEDPGSDRK